jgi:hypothetical protein
MDVIEHKLGINPMIRLVKQKERTYTPDKRDTIQQEISRFLQVGFIKMVDYPSWLADPIHVKKAEQLMEDVYQLYKFE